MNTLQNHPQDKANVKVKTSYSNSTARPDQNVRDTSSDALFDIIHSGKYSTEWRKAGAVLGLIEPATRQMLSKATGYPINKITEYVKQLLKHDIAQESLEKRKCKVTGVRAYYLRIKPKAPKQVKLFSEKMRIDQHTA